MRTVLVVTTVAMVACGDDGGHPVMHADAAVDTRGIDAPADANFDATGTWIDRFHAAAGVVMQSACIAAPSGFVVDPVTAATTPYPGTCMADGSFRIATATPLGTYYLRLGLALYETNKRSAIDLSIDRLGRADVAPISGVALNLDMTGLATWGANDSLVAFAANTGYAQTLAFTSGDPTNGGTTATGSAPWGGYKVDASKQDALQIVQLGAHTATGGLAYSSLDSAFSSINVTMAASTNTNLTGAFSAPTASTLRLRIDATSFNQFVSAVNPSVASRTIDGSLYAAVSPDALHSPSLLSFGMPEVGLATLDFGTPAYGDPFTASWGRYVRIQEGFQIPYTWNSVTSSRTATITRVVTRAAADANIIAASLGPVIAPKLDSVDAFTATHASPVPIVSWSAPTLGSPTDYEVQVYDVTINGSALKFTPVLKLATKQTSIRIPAGFLLGQRQYVFSITARIRQNVDIYATPLRAGDTSASAEVLTALVTADS